MLTCTNKKKRKSNHRRNILCMFLAIVLLFVGLIFGAYVAWISSLALIIFALGFSPYGQFACSLHLQWLVQQEPPAVDILMIIAWLNKFLRKPSFPRIAHPFWPFFIFGLWNIAGIAVTNDLHRSIIFSSTTMYILVIIPFTIWLFRKDRVESSILYYVLFSVYITASVIIVAYILRLYSVGSHFHFLYLAGRPRAFFKDPNVAGPFIVFILLYYLSMYILGKNSIIGWKQIVGILFLLVSLLLTFSRGAFLNALVGVFSVGLIALAAKRQYRYLKLTMAAILAIILIFFASPLLGQQRFTRINNYDINGRAAAWVSAMYAVKDHLLGIGPGQFEYYSVYYQKYFVRNSIITPSAHNVYLRVLAENGLPGFAIFLLAFFYLYYIMLHTITLSLKVGDYSMIVKSTWILSSITGILVEGLVVDVLHWRHLGLAIGLAYLYYFSIADE